MAAATQNRNTPRREATRLSLPVAANTNIWAGTIVSVLTDNSGAVPGGTASSGKGVGVAQERANNTGGAAGAIRVTVEQQEAFRFGNSASGDLIAISDIGNLCYIVDDQTVAKTSNSGARPAAGVVADVDANGVWVIVGRN